jgi:hypothetical protein
MAHDAPKEVREDNDTGDGCPGRDRAGLDGKIEEADGGGGIGG